MKKLKIGIGNNCWPLLLLCSWLLPDVALANNEDVNRRWSVTKKQRSGKTRTIALSRARHWTYPDGTQVHYSIPNAKSAPANVIVTRNGKDTSFIVTGHRDMAYFRSTAMGSSNPIEPAPIEWYSDNNFIGKSVLDLAAGQNSFVADIAKLTDSVMGIDIVRHHHLRGRKHFKRVQAEAMPFDNDAFDLIYSHYGPFEMGAESGALVKRILHESMRVLRPGGELRITPLSAKNLERLVPWIDENRNWSWDIASEMRDNGDHAFRYAITVSKR